MSGLPGDSYYRRLQLDERASREDVVHAYRRLALGLHPDARPEDPEAAGRFMAITEAYEVLADPERRAAYDRDVGSRELGRGRIEVCVVDRAGRPAGEARGVGGPHHVGPLVLIGRMPRSMWPGRSLRAGLGEVGPTGWLRDEAGPSGSAAHGLARRLVERRWW